mgnify:CR=1 FL=1
MSGTEQISWISEERHTPKSDPLFHAMIAAGSAFSTRDRAAAERAVEALNERHADWTDNLTIDSARRLAAIYANPRPQEPTR